MFRRISICAVAAALALLWALAGVSRARAVGASGAIGRGDLTFYLDTAAFLGDGGNLIEEVSIRIPNNELRFREHDGVFRCRVRLTVEIVDRSGKRVVADRKERTFEEPDENRAGSPRYFQTVMKRYRLAPGVYTLSYAVEDLEAPARSVFGRLKHRFQTSAVRNLRVVLRSIPIDAPSFSDARFLWDIDRSVDPPMYHPNPSRLYGLYRDTLMVYIELYLPDDLARAPEFEFRSQIVDDTLATVASARLSLHNPGARWGSSRLRAFPVIIRHDLNKLPAGQYDLYVAVSEHGRLLQRIRCGRFSVAWDMRTWETPRRAYLAEARFLLDDTNYDEFQDLSPGEQEARVAALWAREDPNPETKGNEAYREFLSRLDFVRMHYADSDGPGFSPRATIYLKFGPPDEIVQDVVPVNRNTTEEAIGAVKDKFHAMNFSSHSLKPGMRGVTQSIIVDPRQLGGRRLGDIVAYPFELWIYTAHGHPILRRDRASEMDIGMRYLFVDRTGYGRYRLESSSSISNK